MDPVASLDTETLTVCIDFKNPHAYLALPPTIALADALGLSVNWLPHSVAPIERPPPVADNDDRGVRHRRFRAQYAARDIGRYAKVHGLIIEDLYRRPDVTLAALGLLWARRFGAEAAQRYVQAVCSGHWQASLDIENRGALTAVLEACGAAAGGFESFELFTNDEGCRQLEALKSALDERGVFSVPAYLVADQCFMGRAHLPLIREWLDPDRMRWV